MRERKIHVPVAVAETFCDTSSDVNKTKFLRPRPRPKPLLARPRPRPK